MMGTLFLTKEMPEPPKQGFFKGLFGGGPSILDKEELCKCSEKIRNILLIYFNFLVLYMSVNLLKVSHGKASDSFSIDKYFY